MVSSKECLAMIEKNAQRRIEEKWSDAVDSTVGAVDSKWSDAPSGYSSGKPGFGQARQLASQAARSVIEEKWSDAAKPGALQSSPGYADKSSPTLTVEIVLDPEVLRALCVRGRRRFRDIKAAGQADLKLDVLRGVMQVTGTKSSIADVRRRLATVSGPCMNVTAAVWAELMRTRMNPDPSEAAVPRLQEASGCRIHIERDAKQVRLFGPKDQVAIAQKLLSDLDRMCIEQAVEIQAPQYLDLEVLEAFASEFGVTLHVEEAQIVVLGIDGAVWAAAQELKDYDSDDHPSGLGSSAQGVKPSEAARAAISEAMTRLKVDSEYTKASSPHSTYSTCDSLPSSEEFSTSAPAPAEKLMQGAVMYKQQMEEKQQVDMCDTSYGACSGVCSACSDCRRYFAQRGRHASKYSSSCQTCAAANFCMFCGAPTPKMQKNATAFHPQQAYQPDMSCVDPNMMMMPMQQGMMMPMQVMQQTMMAADGSMVMMAPNGMVPMQQYPMMPNGMQQCGMQQVQPAMMANGMQQCMVQMPLSYATG